MKIKTVLTPLN